MELYLSLVLACLLLPLQVCCQTVQDDWTAPAAPDGSTPLQNSAKFTLLWKSTLQNNFKTYCPSCDPSKLDLWITNFNGTQYKAKLARGVDVTTTSSWDWTVSIASSEFSSQDWWVFRFTFFDSTDPYTQQISSPGFKISGLIKTSSTSSVQSSSTVSAITSSSIVITSTSAATNTVNTTPSNSGTSPPTLQTSAPVSSSKNNVWISGVVVGPVVGIALGAALMWFCLRKRKNKRAQQNQGHVGHHQGDYHQQYSPSHDFKEGYSQTTKNNQQLGSHDQYIAEAPGSAIPAEPAELWQGNYNSRS